MTDVVTKIRAERDALQRRVEVLEEACNQSRLAFAGYVSAQSAINKLDRAAREGEA